MTAELEYMEGENFNEIGSETTLVATVRYRSLLYNANLDLFNEFAASDPSIDLARHVELAADPRVVPRLQDRPAAPASACPR